MLLGPLIRNLDFGQPIDVVINTFGAELEGEDERERSDHLLPGLGHL